MFTDAIYTYLEMLFTYNYRWYLHMFTDAMENYWCSVRMILFMSRTLIDDDCIIIGSLRRDGRE